MKRILEVLPDHHFMLSNGTTIHGAQYRHLSREQNSVSSYYGPSHEVAQVLQQQKSRPIVGIIGLGSGTMVCQFLQSQLEVFEIDPDVIALTQRPYFTYVKDCPPHAIHLGDGRIQVQHKPDQHFDALFLDAFSSDSIPIHLLTQEAFTTYLKKLSPDGLIAVHVSQRHMDLVPVVKTIAEQWQWTVIANPEKPLPYWQLPSSWLVMSHNAELLSKLKHDYHWQTVPPKQPLLWTDDYANLFSIIKW